MTEKPSPIEALKQALCPAGNCGSPVCAAAREALGQVEAAVAALRIALPAVKGAAEVQYLPELEAHPAFQGLGPIPERLQQIRAALAPFPVKP